MSDQPKSESSISQRSNIVRTSRWRRVLIMLAWTVTIIGLWYGEENWRGRRAWNQYRKATEARGESLNFATFIPKPVADEQNFAATPFLKSLVQPNLTILTNDLWNRADNYISDFRPAKEHGHRHFTDLVAWQMASASLASGELKRDLKFVTDKTDLASRAAAAPAVLEGLKPDEAAFDELFAASRRPYSRYPVAYDLENPWMILIPHLSKIKQVCQRLNLKACAEVAASQPEQALADLKLMLSLADSIKSEPFVISYLVRLACVHIAIQTAWEGLAEHRWTEAQLQELQSSFLAYDFLADLEQPLKAERAAGILTVDLAKKKGLGDLANSEDANQKPVIDKEIYNLIGRLMPAGWYDEEKLNYGILFGEAQMNGGVDLTLKKISPKRVEANANEVTRQVSGVLSGSALKAVMSHRIIAALLLQSLVNLPKKTAKAQVIADQAALACALERYRLANGQFPETLDALTPRFISHQPNDVINGQPYKYRRTDDGQFILYSVGWNEKDDGGVPGKTLFDELQGDWVWEYPVK